ncbi:hypothetical protein LTS17_008023 [Exophiala oligosperma]
MNFTAAKLDKVSASSYQTLAPFSREDQLNEDLHEIPPSHVDREQHLPGHPRISLRNVPLSTSFLERKLCSEELDRMAPHLWMMSLNSSTNISPLHRQLVKGRDIVITEDPMLHLVWLPDRIYVKPLPAYLLSFVFWDHYLLGRSLPLTQRSRDRIREAALGYLRTWSYLVRHESDLFLAQKFHLIPSSISWAQFCAFTSLFDAIADADVSKRYAFGELRLTRLNLYCKLFLGKMRLHRFPATTYGTYFSRFKTPFLFVFAVLSVVLNAVQVGLAVEPLTARQWPGIWTMGRVLMVLTLCCSLTLTVFLGVLFMLRFGLEWRHAILDEIYRRRTRVGMKKNSIAGDAV